MQRPSRAFIQACPAEVPGFREAFVLKGTQYYAHSEAAKSGKRLDRNSASDKELYDKSRRIQKAYDENRAAQAEAPGVTTKVSKDLEVDGLQDPVVAAVPVVAGDRVAGMVQAELAATSVSTSSRELWLIGVAVLAAVAMAFVSFVTPGFALYAAILLIAFVVIASQQILGNEQQTNYLNMVENRARLAAGLGRALEAAGASMSPEMLAAISADVQGVRYGDLRQVNKTEQPAGSPTNASLADQYAQQVGEPSIQDGPSRVVIGRDAVQQVFDKHSRTLTLAGAWTRLCWHWAFSCSCSRAVEPNGGHAAGACLRLRVHATGAVRDGNSGVHPIHVRNRAGLHAATVQQVDVRRPRQLHSSAFRTSRSSRATSTSRLRSR
jgi:hypothetical protein